eukprot:1868099-Amphidinium_carterae.2
MGCGTCRLYEGHLQDDAERTGKDKNGWKASSTQVKLSWKLKDDDDDAYDDAANDEGDKHKAPRWLKRASSQYQSICNPSPFY